jgi:hypothetical protein
MRRTRRKHPDLLTKAAIFSSAMTSARISLMQFVVAVEMIRRRRNQFSNDDTKDSEIGIRSRKLVIPKPNRHFEWECFNQEVATNRRDWFIATIAANRVRRDDGA